MSDRELMLRDKVASDQSSEGIVAAVELCTEFLFAKEAFEEAENKSPLGNATPEDLGWEVAYLLRPYGKVTGEVRYVDGGYHIRG